MTGVDVGEDRHALERRRKTREADFDRAVAQAAPSIEPQTIPPAIAAPAVRRSAPVTARSRSASARDGARGLHPIAPTLEECLAIGLAPHRLSRCRAMRDERGDEAHGQASACRGHSFVRAQRHRRAAYRSPVGCPLTLRLHGQPDLRDDHVARRVHRGRGRATSTGARPDADVHAYVNDSGARSARISTAAGCTRRWSTGRRRTPSRTSARRAGVRGAWQAAEKVVFSTTLDESRARGRGSSESSTPRRCDGWKTEVNATRIDGPELAAQAIRAGIVDEIHMFVCPDRRRRREAIAACRPRRQARAGGRAALRERRRVSPLPVAPLAGRPRGGRGDAPQRPRPARRAATSSVAYRVARLTSGDRKRSGDSSETST